MDASEGGDMSVAVIGDWDADGIVAAAQFVYTQETLGAFPLRGRVHVDLIPSGPRGFRDKVLGRCWEHLIIVDIPFTADVQAGLEDLESRCKFDLYYFDHHDTTARNKGLLEGKFKALVIVGPHSTSHLVRSFLEKMGIKLTPRLRQFIEAVDYIEGGPRLHNNSEGAIKIVVSMSKRLNITKSQEEWQKFVRWLASPIPFDELELALGRDAPEIITESLRTSKEADEELREIAMNFAISAKRVGFVRLVDARGKWAGRGASALASAIHKTVKEPVVLLVSKDDGTTLVIVRSSRGEAERIVRHLFDSGVVEDKGGHQNIAIARLSKGVSVAELEKVLLRASLLMNRDNL
ncbi:MAG: phosphoesterase [Acidilobaceae archaeon]|nr:phosphoesterase [Acidilobaceae archaeon]